MIVWIKEIDSMKENQIVIVTYDKPYYEVHVIHNDRLYRVSTVSEMDWETVKVNYTPVKIPANSNVLPEVRKRMPEFFL